jgi:outer membrane protein assembly factor BamB
LQTDEQILQRIAEVPPAALRRDEIARLKNRLVESAALRDKLLADEAGRDYVQQALARVDSTWDAVIADAERHRPVRESHGLPAWVWVIGFLGGAAVTVLVIWILRGMPTQRERPAQTAKSQPDVSVDEDELKTFVDLNERKSNDGVIDELPLPPNPDPPADQVKAPGDEGAANPQAVDDVVLDKTHPLQYELIKEGFNVAVELKQALDNRAYAGALHVIANRRADLHLGLLSDVVDSQLLIPYPAMVRLAMRDHPQLRDLMRRRFSATAQLRVRRAMAQIDVQAVRSLTLQFFGTDAAAEAEAWLGDRALSGGQFTEAVSRYERALSGAAASRRQGVAARLRLASAMIGLKIGSPPLKSVVIGSATIDPAEFEKMVGEMLKRSSQRDESRPRGGMTGADVPRAPPAMQYRTRRFAEVDGGVLGWNKSWKPAPGPDWVARGMAVAVTAATAAGELLVVSNRSQLFALDRSTGRQRWQANFVKVGGHLPAWYWPPMHPLVVGQRIYVRRLAKTGPELACVDARSGTVLWSSIPKDRDKKASRRNQPGSHVASDPLLVDGKLLALTATVGNASLDRSPAKDAPRLFQIALVAYDPHNGRVISTVDLIQLRDVWQGVLPARAAVAGDGNGIIATVGGVALRIDGEGNILWLRRQRWRAQQPGDPSWQQFHSRPLVQDDRVFVFQPGMRSVQCLDLVSGRAIWKRGVPGVQRIVGLVEGQLIVRDARGLLALSVDDGSVTWRRALDHLLETYACGAADRLLVARLQIKNNLKHIELLWLDPSSGATRTACPLDDLAESGDLSPTAAFGPVLLSGDRLLVGFAPKGGNPSGGKNVGRELIELIPTDKPK